MSTRSSTCTPARSWRRSCCGTSGPEDFGYLVPGSTNGALRLTRAATKLLGDQFGDFGPGRSPALVVADREPGDQPTTAPAAERGEQIGETIGDVRCRTHAWIAGRLLLVVVVVGRTGEVAHFAAHRVLSPCRPKMTGGGGRIGGVCPTCRPVVTGDRCGLWGVGEARTPGGRGLRAAESSKVRRDRGAGEGQAFGDSTAISLSVVARCWASTFSAKSKDTAVMSPALGRSTEGSSTAGFGSAGTCLTKVSTALTYSSWALARVARYCSVALLASA